MVKWTILGTYEGIDSVKEKVRFLGVDIEDIQK